MRKHLKHSQKIQTQETAIITTVQHQVKKFQPNTKKKKKKKEGKKETGERACKGKNFFQMTDFQIKSQSPKRTIKIISKIAIHKMKIYLNNNKLGKKVKNTTKIIL